VVDGRRTAWLLPAGVVEAAAGGGEEGDEDEDLMGLVGFKGRMLIYIYIQ
jgi:hypothetical protein